MTKIASHLANYAAYHRDSRNIAIHMLGIPLIVLAIEMLLSRPSLMAAGFPLTPAFLLAVAAATYYLTLDLRLGLSMTAFLALGLWLGDSVAALPTSKWLTIGLGTFVLGWVLQFIGHILEGRKPAFMDDLRGLLIGPLFVAAEIGFALGLRRDLKKAVDQRTARSS